MMEPVKRLLYWLLEGTKGGPTRKLLLSLLSDKPRNLRQLSLAAGLDYKTVKHHIEILLKNGIVEKAGSGYGEVYFLSQIGLLEKEMFLQGGGDERQKKRRK